MFFYMYLKSKLMRRFWITGCGHSRRNPLSLLSLVLNVKIKQGSGLGLPIKRKFSLPAPVHVQVKTLRTCTHYRPRINTPILSFDYFRLFVMCGKSMTEDILKQSFGRYGKIEEVWVLKDRVTQEPKVKQQSLQYYIKCFSSLFRILETVTSK